MQAGPWARARAVGSRVAENAPERLNLETGGTRLPKRKLITTQHAGETPARLARD
jgi:hypothetical protein